MAEEGMVRKVYTVNNVKIVIKVDTVNKVRIVYED
jgi:hypothetical protein